MNSKSIHGSTVGAWNRLQVGLVSAFTRAEGERERDRETPRERERGGGTESRAVASLVCIVTRCDPDRSAPDSLWFSSRRPRSSCQPSGHGRVQEGFLQSQGRGRGGGGENQAGSDRSSRDDERRGHVCRWVYVLSRNEWVHLFIYHLCICFLLFFLVLIEIHVASFQVTKQRMESQQVGSIY